MKFFFLIFFFYNYLNRGKWSREDDVKIIEFVIENGTKWSKLAKKILNRTEHNIKNRFFSILSHSITMPIRKIKKMGNYRNKEVLMAILSKFFKRETKEEC